MASEKRYVECGIQTDSDLLASAMQLSLSISGQSHNGDASVSLETARSSLRDHSRSSTQFDSAYSHSTDQSDISHSSSSAPSLSGPVRAYSDQLSLGRPSGSNSKKFPSSRVISLPETVSAYSAKAVLERASIRVVSMPLIGVTDSENITLDDADVEKGTTTAEEGYLRTRSQSHVSDMPYTPSPPSSPESVLIIANKNQLAEGFLRGSYNGARTPAPIEDEGWITWAKSPPRPIPALHGPLSLPYARCPSGAEGTIIEEQDNLPRMIWGLEGEDLSSARPRGNSTSHAVQPEMAQRVTPTTNHTNVPPRMQKTKSDVLQHASFRTGKLNPSSQHAIPLERKVPVPIIQSQQEVSRYPITGLEPIDLSDIVRKHMSDSGGRNQEYRVYNNSASKSFNDLRTHGPRDELGFDWQTTLSTEGLRASSMLSPSVAGAGLGVPVSFSSQPLHSLGYSGSSQSPITLEPHRQTSQTARPRRMSALEIAQQYRQQQLLQQQQQNFLPTPPNSSSPIWTSAFSPHQAPALSPELLSAFGLSKLSPSLLQASSALVHSDSIQRTQTLPLRRLDLDALGGIVDVSSLSPSAQIHTNSASHDIALLSQYLQAQTRQGHNPVSHTQKNRAEHSPLQPRPPPNTPLSSLAARENVHHGARQPQSLVGPPSPTSPQTRSRSISHQQARSIPLARLIQRRLSSVPEEDFSSCQSQAQSPGSSERPRTRSYTPGVTSGTTVTSPHLQFLLSPPSPLPRNPRTPSPLHGSVQSRPTTIDEEPDAQHEVTVRLPGSRPKDPVGSGGDIEPKKGGPSRGQQGVKEKSTRSHDSTRGRGQKRGARGRRGRGMDTPFRATNGPERIDGGLVVKS